MAKGQMGASMGGAMEYRYTLKPGTKNCRNCSYYKKQGDPLMYERKCGICNQFGITITDATNAKLCKAFKNKNGSKRRTHSSHTKK